MKPRVMGAAKLWQEMERERIGVYPHDGGKFMNADLPSRWVAVRTGPLTDDIPVAVGADTARRAVEYMLSDIRAATVSKLPLDKRQAVK